MKLFKNPFFYTSLLSLLALGLIIASSVFGWVTPTQAPPEGNIVLSPGALPSGSAGYVQFASSSTAFGGDAALFWDNTNKRLGIGTTGPSEKLDVNGTIKASQLIFGTSLYAARRYVSTVGGISNAGYTTICNVYGDALASGVKISLTGTVNNVVVNTVADILVNNYQDIYIRSEAGIYTIVTLKVLSNANEDFTIQAKTNSANAVTLNIEVFPYGSETVEFSPATTYSTIVLEHSCTPGVYISSTGGASGNFGALGSGYFGGNVGIGTTNPGSYKLYVNGSFYATSKSSAADTSLGRFAFYSQEATEHWFSDFGSSQLENGQATIYLDPIFKEAISEKKPYIVLLSSTSDSNGLYVAEKNKDYFVVKEVKQGNSNATFDYQVVGPRRGYEDVRLEKIEIPKDQN